MYSHNITIQEMADYAADMLEMSATYIPTDAEMERMYEDAKEHGLV